MSLPSNNIIKIAPLASVFRHTTNSYKYYWLLALLKSRKRPGAGGAVSLVEMALHMVTAAWYPVHFFRLSLGKQDKLGEAVFNIAEYLQIPRQVKEEELYQWLYAERERPVVKSTLEGLVRYVPYRFLAPWFSSALRGVPDAQKNQVIRSISAKAFHSNQPPFYSFEKEHIVMHPAWAAYIDKHLALLSGFVLWELTLYLQRNNPNVPAIPQKLLMPRERDLAPARKFWDMCFAVAPAQTCIFSSEVLNPAQYSLDHYLPWSFVVHDQLWNLVPVRQEINSSKSDHLPHTKYLSSFLNIQHQAFLHVAQNGNRLKILEDYALLFNEEIASIRNMPREMFVDTLHETIMPMHQIAKNMGFAAGWEFKG